MSDPSRPDFDRAFEGFSGAKGNGDAHDDDAATIRRLADMRPLDYERVRENEAERLGCRVILLDRMVRAARGDNGGAPGQGREVVIPVVQPWHDAVDGAALLDELATYFADHAFLPKDAENLLALWTLHTWAFEVWRRTPRLNLRSLVRGSGKTTVIELLVPVVWRGKSIDNLTAPVVFRLVELMAPTLLLDECDRILNEKTNAELIGLLDSGHERGKQATRCIGDKFILRDFSAHSPAALAGLGRLPGTLDDRSVIVLMDKMKRSERKAPITDATEALAGRLARQAARWTNDSRTALASADPDMGELFNRPADLWRPLYAVAAVAGGAWPGLARQTQIALAEADDDDAKPLPVRLLADVRAVFQVAFDAAVEAGSALPSELRSQVLVDGLIALDGRPWAEMGRASRPLTQNRMARLLKGFRVYPRDIGPETARTRGYRLVDFDDAFARHLWCSPLRNPP